MMSDLPSSWKATLGTVASFAGLFGLLNSLACGVCETEATETSNPDDSIPDGHYPVPPEARAEDVSSPTHFIGTGTPESCMAEAFIQAVASSMAPTPLSLEPPAAAVAERFTTMATP